MSITVYIEGWDKHQVTTNVYADEFFSNMSPEEAEEYCSADPFCERDENGRIIIFKESKSIDENGVEYPMPNFSNVNFSSVIHFIDPSNKLNVEDGSNALSPEGVNTLHRLIMKRVNSSAFKRLEGNNFSQSGNVCRFIAGKSYIYDACQSLLEVTSFAQSRNLGIYWA